MATESIPTVVVDDKLNSLAEKDTKSTALQWCEKHWQALLSELVATAMLLLFGCMTQCKLPDDVAIPPLYVPLGFGFVVLMNVQIFGHISGAHMNPAISLAAMIWGNLSIMLGLFYMVAQCIGATLGFGLLSLLVSEPVRSEAMCSTIPREDLHVAQALGVEMVLTAALNFVMCSLWDLRNKDFKEAISVKFGFVISGLAIAGAHLSGCSMNPARSLGPAIWNATWKHHWIYWVGPLVGGSFSTILYRFVWKPRSQTSALEEKPVD